MRAGLLAAAREGCDVVLLAGVCTGIYAGSHKERLLREYEVLVNELLAEPMLHTAGGASRLGECFADVVWTLLTPVPAGGVATSATATLATNSPTAASVAAPTSTRSSSTSEMPSSSERVLSLLGLVTIAPLSPLPPPLPASRRGALVDSHGDNASPDAFLVASAASATSAATTVVGSPAPLRCPLGCPAVKCKLRSLPT